LYFGDSTAGYTIAYVFRLSDPKARGRRRAYAFVALAGKDAGRASKSAPMVWEAFAAVAKGIEEKAQRFQESVKLSESSSDGKDYTPVTSFLTQRVTDPDGHPRGTRQVPPRSLAEIVGDEHIFTYLHQYFIAVLRCLGDRFGGLPLADTKSIVGEDDGLPCTLHAELAKVRVDNDTTPTPDTKHRDQIEAAKARMNRCVKRNEKCAPIAVSVQATRQVVV
jgi:Vesicle coat protein involved in Golgi to plasma membrane transport